MSLADEITEQIGSAKDQILMARASLRIIGQAKHLNGYEPFHDAMRSITFAGVHLGMTVDEMNELTTEYVRAMFEADGEAELRADQVRAEGEPVLHGNVTKSEDGAYLASVHRDHPHYALVEGRMVRDQTGNWANLDELTFGAYEAFATLEAALDWVAWHFEREGLKVPSVDNWRENGWRIWPSNDA